MLMSFFAQFFHRCNVPYHYIVEAEYHYVSVDVAIDGMSNGEIKEALETQAKRQSKHCAAWNGTEEHLQNT